jgi:hypothetical protein
MNFESSRNEYKKELMDLPHYESEDEGVGPKIFVMFKPDFMKNSTIKLDGDIQEVALDVEGFLKNEINEDVSLSFMVITPGLLEEQVKQIYHDTYWERFLKPLYTKIEEEKATEEEIKKYNEHMQFFCGGEGPLALLVLNTPYANKEQALANLLEWRDQYRERYPYTHILPNGIYINGIHVDTLDNASDVLVEYGYKNSEYNI